MMYKEGSADMGAPMRKVAKHLRLEGGVSMELDFRELTILSVLLRPLVSVFLGGIIGLERGLKNRAAGFRTYMLVCMGACIVMTTNQYIYQTFGVGDPVRMGAQVISGIGFLGAGTIIVTSKSQIKGLTTAAGLWASACIGLAVGIGFYEIALISCLLVVLVLTLFHSWEDHMRRNAKVVSVYVELCPGHALRDFLQAARELEIGIGNLQMEHSAVPGEEVSFVATARKKDKIGKDVVLQQLRDLPSVLYLEEL